MYHMDKRLYLALIDDDVHIFDALREQDWLKVRDQVTHTNNTVLHVACQHGSKRCVEEILGHADESLLLQINSRDETALHLAARQGHFDAVEALISKAKSSGQQSRALQNLIRAPNVEWETALHAAVRYNHQKVVELLVKEDPGFSYRRNKFDETPLYLAAVRGYGGVTKVILQNCVSPTFGGPQGRTALHAATMSYGGHECMRLLLESNKHLVCATDDDGWTPFHFAADNNQCYAIESLLKVNKYTAYLPDHKYKKTALHVAAYKGYHNVIEKLLKYLPDMWESVDGNGQNILHIAVQQYKKPLLKFILSKTRKFDIMNALIIQRDHEGNTPLHLIAKFGYNVPEMWEWLQRADHFIVDNTNLTPSEVVYNQNFYQVTMDEEVVGVYPSRDEIYGLWTNWTQGRLHTGDKYDPIPAKERITMHQQMANSQMIVAALVTTVALTAGFTVPGGFDSNKGSPLLLSKPAFKIFMIADTLALLFSISSLFLYFSTSFQHKRPRVTLFLLTSGVVLNVISIVAMMVAFIAGTFAELNHSLALAIIVCTISSLFLLLVFSFSIPYIRLQIPLILLLYNQLRRKYSWFKKTLDTFLRRILITPFPKNSRQLRTRSLEFSGEIRHDLTLNVLTSAAEFEDAEVATMHLDFSAEILHDLTSMILTSARDVEVVEDALTSGEIRHDLASIMLTSAAEFEDAEVATMHLDFSGELLHDLTSMVLTSARDVEVVEVALTSVEIRDDLASIVLTSAAEFEDVGVATFEVIEQTAEGGE